MGSARTARSNGFECQAEARTSYTTWRLTTLQRQALFQMRLRRNGCSVLGGELKR
jgi:hypothetical protein